MRQFQRSFSRLAGQTCWGVKRGHGSFLTLEFGLPHLRVREPRAVVGASAPVARLLSRRSVTVRGDWHLWLYCCAWAVFDKSHDLVGDTSSKQKIDRAARFLDGQRLVSATLTPRKLRTNLRFDLGARLVTEPYDRVSEQWYLYEPEGKVLALRADRTWSYHPGNQPPETIRWRALRA